MSKSQKPEWHFTVERIPDISAGLAGAEDYWYDVTAIKDQPGLWQGLPAAVEQRFQVRLGKAKDGRLVCTGLILGVLRDHVLPTEIEIQARTLRDIPLAQVLSQVARGMATDPEAAKFFEVGIVPFEQPRLRPGPKGHSQEFFRSIAQNYRAALEREPRAPVKAVREAINFGRPRNQQVSDITVRRWIKRALKQSEEEA